jgi:flagellar protein FliO/FliZ
MVPAIRITLAAAPSRLAVLPAGLLPMLAHAQAAPAQDIGGSLVQLVLGLGLVLALLFASLWLLKRLSAPRGEAAGTMRVISGIAVGARERVVVVEVGGNWLVLGVAPGRVTALAEMPRGQLPPTPAATGTPAVTRDFASRLRQMLDRRNAP